MGYKETDAECFEHRVYLCISQAVGFASNSLNINNATAEEWANTSQYYVDWVYVYQLDDGKQIIELLK